MDQTMIHARLIDPLTAGDQWSVLWPMLRPAVEIGGNCWTELSLLGAITLRHAQVWLIEEDEKVFMVVVTELQQHPGRTVCNIWLAGGERLTDALKILPDIEKWAKASGATRIHAMCRPGMGRALRVQGYTNRYEIVARELT